MHILIAILSCHGNAGRRAAQRATWLQQRAAVDYRFFLGHQTAVQPLYKESRELDEVMLDCPDDYPRLRLKTLAMVRWAFMHGYEYLFKCDDDTYVRVDRLLDSGFERHEYSGFLEERGPFSGCSMEPAPWAQGGAGYWLSRNSMQVVIESLITLKQEDTAVGRTLCANGIYGHHDIRYQPTLDGGIRPDAITCHKAEPDMMRSLDKFFATHFAQL